MGFSSFGNMLVTAGVDSAMEHSKAFTNFVGSCINRYLQFDWGDLCEEDINSNKVALRNGYRIFASYNMPEAVNEELDMHETSVWIITEADRSCTTILFPSEY